MVEPVSPDTVITPPTCVASAAVAPPVTPVPNAKVGTTGAIVSTVAVTAVVVVVLPTVSVATAVKLCEPSVSEVAL